MLIETTVRAPSGAHLAFLIRNTGQRVCEHKEGLTVSDEAKQVMEEYQILIERINESYLHIWHDVQVAPVVLNAVKKNW